jgi:hypothetical protein
MPVVYHCPHCRQPVTVPDQMLGQVLGCPHCRGGFQTLPPQAPVAAPVPVAPPAPPPPPPPQQNPFSLDDAARGDDDDDHTPRRRSYQSAARRQAEQQKVPLSSLIAMICAVIGGVVMTFVNQHNRKPGQGFDVKEVLYSGLVGGVCAALGFLIGKLIEGNSPDRRKPQRRYGRDDRED